MQVCAKGPREDLKSGGSENSNLLIFNSLKSENSLFTAFSYYKIKKSRESADPADPAQWDQIRF